MNEKKLTDLAVGDKVILWRHRTERVRPISRIMPSFIEVDGMKFRPDTGSEKSRSKNRFYFNAISVPKDGDIERITIANRKAWLASKLSETKWSDMTLEKLELVFASVAAQ